MRPELKGAIAGVGVAILGRWGGAIVIDRWPWLRRIREWAPGTSDNSTPETRPGSASRSTADDDADVSPWDEPMTTVRIDLDSEAALESGGSTRFASTRAPGRVGFTRSMTWVAKGTHDHQEADLVDLDR